MSPDDPASVPPAPSDDRDPLSTGLDALRARLKGADVRLEVIGLVPGRADHERHVNRAEARVLVTATVPAETTRALFALQSDAALHLEAVPDALWSPLGRSPEAAFLVSVPLADDLPVPTPPLVRHPLDVRRVPLPVRPDPHPAAARRP